jgi:hypothetical protein
MSNPTAGELLRTWARISTGCRECFELGWSDGRGERRRLASKHVAPWRGVAMFVATDRPNKCDGIVRSSNGPETICAEGIADNWRDTGSK